MLNKKKILLELYHHLKVAVMLFILTTCITFWAFLIEIPKYATLHTLFKGLFYIGGTIFIIFIYSFMFKHISDKKDEKEN